MTDESTPMTAPTPHTPEYAGLVAVVTGGASGIGLATARELRARGAEVAVLDLAESDEPFLHVRCDVTDDAAVRAAIDTVTDRLGGVNVLVNNAGMGAQGTVEDNGPDEWHRVLDVNVVGVARVTAAALPALRKAAAGERDTRRSSTCARSPRPPDCPSARSTPRARARSWP